MKVVKSGDVAKVTVEVEGAKDVEIRRLICKEDGADNFAMRMFELKPGGCTPLPSIVMSTRYLCLREEAFLFVKERNTNLALNS